MRKLIYILLSIILLSVTSCEETMETNQLDGKTGLVVYSFPTVGDTFAIRVSLARSINGDIRRLNNLNIRSFVNESEDKIIRSDSTSIYGIPVLTYLSIGNHKQGDRIRISVKAEELPEAYGETSIPASTAFERTGVDTVYHNGDFYSLVRIRFNKGGNGNYYAVRLLGMNVFEEVDSVSYEYEELESDFEPLFNGGTKADIGFGTTNSYYHNMYAVDLSDTKDPVIELRLATLYRNWTESYKVELLTLTPEFYLMLKSLNDIANNDFGEYGLSLIHPSYTNVLGGWGCIAGYN